MTFGPDVTVHPLFRRRIRLTQMLFLFPTLAPRIREDSWSPRRAGATCCCSTSRPRARRAPPDKVFLYFHWFRETPRKLWFLRTMAARQPEIVIFGTTDSVVDVFRRCGFANVVSDAVSGAARPLRGRRGSLPAPALCGRRPPGQGLRDRRRPCRTARRGKENIPIAVQITADHYGKYDAATRADIARLEAMRYPSLTLIRETPSPEEYAANFPGGICLQPYDREDFRDRVSGVTLDALAHGCPIVATAGTWSAAMMNFRRRHRACQSRRQRRSPRGLCARIHALRPPRWSRP